MSSRQKPLHLSSCYCDGYRFWGGLSLSRVLWKSACSRSFHACIFLSSAFMSFHFPFMFLSLVFNSINFPFIFLSFSFQCAFMSPHLPFISTHFPFILHSCPFISFLKLRKWLYLWLSLRSSNMWHCSKEICHKTTERESESEREREKERKRARKKERERASWMPNATVSAGNRAPQVEFPSLVLPVLYLCTSQV